MKCNSLLLVVLFISMLSYGQLNIQSGATFFIDAGATVTVQGDVTSNANIMGTGKLLMKGTALQNLNLNGFTVPNLEIDNTNNIALTSHGRIGNSLLFTNGKIQTGNFNLLLADVATASGAGTGKFVETNGTGQLRKEISSNLSSYVLPLGYNTSYTPISLTTSGTYASAYVGVSAKNTAHPNKPIRSTDYLKTYWPMTRSGITGTATAVAQYNESTDFNGVESDMRGIIWDGTNWSLSGASINTATNAVTANILPAGLDVYAMNRFVYLNSKIFLQGAYTSGTQILGTPVMNEALRTPSNLIPLTDPYRSAPYSATFTHVNNTVPETANVGVFSAQPDARNNIVDWVFVELRNTSASPGNTVLQTRSALLQRDGDVVEIDGVSQLYFKNIDANNFTITVRHRNHLGLSTDPAGYTKSLSEQNSTLLDFTTASDAALYGTTPANYATVNGLNMLYAGNANFNANTRYTGPGNDRDYILGSILGSNVSTVLSNVYNQGDVNMNRNVRYTGPGNDRDYILGSVLGSNVSSVRIQTLPN